MEAQTEVHMGPQAGAQIRGSLWQALNEHVCTAPSQSHNPDHALHCPKCFLLELQTNSPRGNNPPRPFAIRPPLGVRAEDDRIYPAGVQFSIGMTLMGKATALFPYLVNGMWQAGQHGVGYRRGQFTITAIRNDDILRGKHENLLDGTNVFLPQTTIQRRDILEMAALLPTEHIRLRFLTTTTLKQHRKIIKYPEFKPLIGRLLERCQALAWHYGDTSGQQAIWKPIHDELTAKAEAVRRVQDNTRQVQFYSGSRRSNYSQTISGFVGEVLFEGDMSPFLEWLVWGQSIQVGKNTVKGNGWYEIVAES
ncbi:MAG: CRISPR system precrRNA processing endoribonuclease RAMP protein Cas6 [Anaerolineae bacterium]|nr:CRISPR system precrRNA processing endoribonuclease RAMP protein Cas6 [Anaerolineae bacterium]